MWRGGSRVAVWSETRREAFARRLQAAGKLVQVPVPDGGLYVADFYNGISPGTRTVNAWRLTRSL